LSAVKDPKLAVAKARRKGVEYRHLSDSGLVIAYSYRSRIE
jgi:hypothetical protein